MFQLRSMRHVAALAAMLIAAACSNGRGSVEEGAPQSEPPPNNPGGSNFAVSGAVSGLTGSGLVLQLNGAGDLQIAADGPFTFTNTLANSAAYSVTVRTQPTNPAQTCTVANASGVINGANVSNVAVVCSTGSTSFTVGGAVTGLLGSGLVLRNNGGDDLAISEDGEFTFATPVASGASYFVQIAAEPSNPAQRCSLQNERGVVGEAPVTNIAIVCSTSAFNVSGSVNGLMSGSRVSLRLNQDVITVENGAFSFPTTIASGAPYEVRIEALPNGQSCSIENATGVIGNGPVNDVRVSCAANKYSVGGQVTGLAPNARLVLEMQTAAGTTRYTVRTNGSYTFPQLIENGGSYVVKVQSNPENPSQECRFSDDNDSGIITAANVTNVNVQCTTNTFPIGGSLRGYTGSGLVLRLNGGNDLSVPAGAGSFVFSQEVASGSAYEVSVLTQPINPAQTCQVVGGSGTVGVRNVSNIEVSCSTNTYAIRGAVTGLVGDFVRLQNGVGGAIEVAGDGAFAFTGVPSGSNYNITVTRQPRTPTQVCEVTANQEGTVGGADVTGVTVECTTSSFTLGGVVEGLSSSGLILRSNGQDVAISGAGAFQFPTALPSGTAYAVEIAAQPNSPPQFCTVEDATGVIDDAHVTSVRVSCETLTVGGSVLGLVLPGLTLQLNGAETLTIEPGALVSFQFTTPLASGAPYDVAIITQPGPQTCSITNQTGVMGTADADNVSVNCL